MQPILTTTQTPTPNQVRAIRAGLSAYNVAQVPALTQLPSDSFNVIYRDDDGVISGGAVCEADWGYLFIDTLWTADEARGKGIGTQIMQAAEAYALQLGLKNAYLFTADFQAKPFYERIGYEVFGVLHERPRFGKTYYMQKALSAVMPDNPHISIQNPPIQADIDILVDGLLQHADENNQSIPLYGNKIAVLLHDGDTLVGGAYGGWFWDWFDLRYLWVDESVRGYGQGARIMQELFKAIRPTLRGVVCDTASFQSLGFYQKLGFDVIGTLDNRPPNHESYFLAKTF